MRVGMCKVCAQNALAKHYTLEYLVTKDTCSAMVERHRQGSTSALHRLHTSSALARYRLYLRSPSFVRWRLMCRALR